MVREFICMIFLRSIENFDQTVTAHPAAQQTMFAILDFYKLIRTTLVVRIKGKRRN